MANRIVAIDLGAWSVKVAIAQPGLRHASLVAFVERPIPPAAPGGDEPWERRAQATLAGIVRDHAIAHDNVYAVVPGDHVFSHVLEFGFKTLRRPDLEKAVGAELEGMVPIDLEDMVYTFEPLPADAPRPPEESAAEAPAGRVAPPTDGLRVLTYAMAQARARAWLELLQGAGVQVRGLLPEGGPMARLVERAPSLASARAAGAVAVVDVGHLRTDVVVVRGGRPAYARTLTRGGRHLSDAIARHWKLEPAQAEQAKHSDGFVASAGMPAASEAWQRVSEVIITEAAPLARELRQTVAACRARTGAAVGAVLLCGGSARLRGLASYLGEQLGAPVTTLTAGDVEALVGGKHAGEVQADAAALCLGVLADAGTGRPLFDLRQGPLAAKVDLSFLRARAGQLALAASVVAAAATASAYAAHYKLRRAERVLTERLAVESAEEFGTPQTAKQVLLGAGAVTVAAAASPLPKMTAWDLLLDISARVPPRDKVTLDVSRLEIDERQITIKGTVKTPEEVDDVEAALRSQACFTDVTRGTTQQNAEGRREFEFTIKPDCM